MEIKIVESVKDVECDVLIINKFEEKQTACDLVNEFLPEEIKGKKGETFVIHTHGKKPAKNIMVVGFGKEEEISNNVIRENVAKAIKKCGELKAKKVGICFATDFNYGGPAVLGAKISDYRFDKYKTKKDHHIDELYLSNVDTNLVDKAIVVANSMELSRNLANEPAAYATPTKLAQIAQSLDGIDTEVFDHNKIEQMGMGAYLAVAKGSVEPPKFIHMKYVPKKLMKH